MDSEVLVSVYCAAYNHAPFIRKALDGILMQKTNFRFEIVVYDDASTDNTQEIIREYAAKYPDIIKPILKEENTYSKHIDRWPELEPLLRGKYLAFCEGDDFWINENKLQKQVDYMESHPKCTVCYTNACFLDDRRREEEDLSQTLMPRDFPDIDLDIREYLRDYMCRKTIGSTASTLMRTEVFPHFHWMNRFSFGDAFQGLFSIAAGYLHYMAEPMSVYRINNPNSYNGVRDRKPLLEKNREWIKYWAELRDALTYFNIETKYEYNEDVQNMRQYILDTYMRHLYATSDRFIWRHNFIPGVSVILTGIDNMDKLKFTMSSLLTQTFDTFEVILIINNKHIDEAKSIYGEAQNVRIFGAPAGADTATLRNLGVKLARGHYVTFMRSGDVMARELLQVYGAMANQSGAAVIYPTGVYEATSPDAVNRQELTLQTENNPVTEHTVFRYNLADRLNRLFADGWYKDIEGCWYNKEFLVANDIAFHSLEKDDFRFTFECLTNEGDCVKTPMIGYVKVGWE